MKRRARGEGGVYWDAKRQRFIAEKTVGYDGRGRPIRRRGSGKSRSAALDALRERIKDFEAGLVSDAERYTVADAIRDWLEYGQGTISDKTVTKHRQLAQHAINGLGGMKLRDLRAEHVDRWLKSLARTHATSTLRSIRWCLSRVVRQAMARDWVARNVVELTHLPAGTGGRPSKSLTLEQARDILQLTAGHPMHDYIVVSMLVGLRTEEARALRWEHVHLPDNDHGTPYVEVWRSDRVGGDTKTEKSRRTLALPSLVVETLRNRLASRPEGQAWVFATQTGTTLDVANVRRDFRSALSKVPSVNPKEWTPRELRHSFVSLMSQSGVPLEEISRLVGHSSTVVTQLVYRHELRPVLQAGAQAMDSLFEGEDHAS
jgi:integrase